MSYIVSLQDFTRNKHTFMCFAVHTLCTNSTYYSKFYVSSKLKVTVPLIYVPQCNVLSLVRTYVMLALCMPTFMEIAISI